MPNAGTVNVVLTAVTGPFEAGMNKAAGLVKSFGSALTSVKTLATGFLAFKGIEFVKGMMEAVDQTAKLADRLGASTEAVIGLQHAGDLAGVSIEAISTNMEKMSRNLADAGDKASPVTQALKAMGIAVSDIKGKAPEVQLGMIADGLQKIGGPGERAAAAVDIFGKAGAGMINMLADGSKGLRDAREEADALGLTFSRLDAAKVEQANDALSKVGDLFKGAFTQAAIALAPTIEGIANAFVSAAKSAGGMGQIALTVVDALKTGAGIAADAWNVLRAGWDAGRVALNMIGAAFAWVGEKVTVAIQWWSGLWQNWVRLVQSSVQFLRDDMTLLWSAAKVPLAMFVQFAGEKLSNLLHTAAEAAGAFDAELGAKLIATAGKISAATGDAAASAKKDFKESQKAIVSSAREMKAAWDGMFVIDTSGSQIFRDMHAGFMKAGEQAAVDFMKPFNAVINRDGSTSVAQMLAQWEAMSAELAAKTEAARASELARDRAYTEQKLADQKMFNEFYLAENEAAAQAEIDAAKAKQSWLFGVSKTNAEKQADWDKKTGTEKLDFAASVFGNLASLQNTHSKRAFQLGKAAAMAQAVVSTASGIARAFGELPFWVAIPAAAAIAVAGGVQISTIASTQFGGGGSVSSAGGSVPLVSGEPVGVAQASGASFASRNDRPVQELRIVGLNDDAIVSGKQARSLLQQLADTLKDGGGSTTFNLVPG